MREQEQAKTSTMEKKFAVYSPQYGMRWCRSEQDAIELLKIWRGEFADLYQPILMKVVDNPVEIQMNELESLRQRIDQFEREKRGIGPEDQYA